MIIETTTLARSWASALPNVHKGRLGSCLAGLSGRRMGMSAVANGIGGGAINTGMYYGTVPRKDWSMRDALGALVSEVLGGAAGVQDGCLAGPLKCAMAAATLAGRSSQLPGDIDPTAPGFLTIPWTRCPSATRPRGRQAMPRSDRDPDPLRRHRLGPALRLSGTAVRVDTNYFDPAVQVQTLDPMPTKRQTPVFKELCRSLTVKHTWYPGIDLILRHAIREGSWGSRFTSIQTIDAQTPKSLHPARYPPSTRIPSAKTN